MQGHRIERVSEMIREKLGMLLLRRVKDPRVQGITITEVRVSGDLSVAKVYYATGSDGAEAVSRALRRAAPFLRRELGATLRLRKTPELRFYRDEALERGERIDSILRELHEDDR